MASLLVSISFHMPLSVPKFSFKGSVHDMDMLFESAERLFFQQKVDGSFEGYDGCELQLRKSAISRLSGQPTSGTETCGPAFYLLSYMTSNFVYSNEPFGHLQRNWRDTFCESELRWMSHNCNTHFYELVSSCMHVSSCTHKIINGYWLGPDIEDGWGFVEGFVNQIT
ncbi:hypothetical protein SADUNF_Sadunf05G0016500 [Salix dunnii]|uniref:Uncharacterized protein n=1 Tax=Salix dunnii TaxID=1413687 RepID=A0A835K930_9ROSI|nr:hypothetical protein SADUNF_Sadunf05G0016500 [Salix dunnii]